MFSENVESVQLYRGDHRIVVKAPVHNEKEAGRNVTARSLSTVHMTANRHCV